MRKATLAASTLFLLFGLAACDEPAKAPAPAPPAAEPAKPPPPPAPVAAAAGGDAGAAKPKMVAPTDGLSLADRIAKRQAEEKKVADQLAAEEKVRLLKYDKGKLPLHTQVFAFIKATRAKYDATEKKLAGAADKGKARDEVEKQAGALRASIEATGKKMATIDPKGGNSNVTTDYDVMLNSLANDYPAAIAAAIDGDSKALDEQRAELDKRSKKIEDWLAELKKAPKK
jgi:hypothetical protein